MSFCEFSMSFRSTIDSMEGIPAGIGDWHLVRIFREGGRLLSKHFRAFLPAIIFFILPASVIKVLHTQFMVAGFVGPQVVLTLYTCRGFISISHLSGNRHGRQIGCKCNPGCNDCQGSTDSEPTFWTSLDLLELSHEALPKIMIVLGFSRMCQVLKDTIYVSDYIRICQILKDTIYASGYKTDERHSESLYMAVKSAVKLALTPKVDTGKVPGFSKP